MSEPQAAPQSLADLTPALVARLRDGDADAGKLLCDLYNPPLMRFSFRYLGSQDEAEDVVQEVFLRVLKNDTQPVNFRAWVYKIARNRCLDVIRSRGRRVDDQDMPEASRIDAELTGCLTARTTTRNTVINCRIDKIIVMIPDFVDGAMSMPWRDTAFQKSPRQQIEVGFTHFQGSPVRT